MAVTRLGPAIAGLAMSAGAAFAWWLATGVRTACQDAVGRPIAAGEPGCPAPLAYVVTHPTGWWEFDHVFGPIVLMLSVGLSFLSAAYLVVYVRRRVRG